MDNQIIHDYGDCPICFDNLEKNIAVTACFHKFHFNCISEWIEVNLNKNIISKCPCCNLRLQVVNVFNQKEPNICKKIKSNKINLYTLNKLNFNIVNNKRFPVIKLLKLLPEKNSLYETVIVSVNDTLVELFLKEKIKYTDIQKKLFAIIKKREFLKFKKIYPKNTKDIIKLNNYVRLNVLKNVYKS